MINQVDKRNVSFPLLWSTSLIIKYFISSTFLHQQSWWTDELMNWWTTELNGFFISTLLTTLINFVNHSNNYVWWSTQSIRFFDQHSWSFKEAFPSINFIDEPLSSLNFVSFYTRLILPINDEVMNIVHRSKVLKTQSLD